MKKARPLYDKLKKGKQDLQLLHLFFSIHCYQMSKAKLTVGVAKS